MDGQNAFASSSSDPYARQPSLVPAGPEMEQTYASQSPGYAQDSGTQSAHPFSYQPNPSLPVYSNEGVNVSPTSAVEDEKHAGGSGLGQGSSANKSPPIVNNHSDRKHDPAFYQEEGFSAMGTGQQPGNDFIVNEQPAPIAGMSYRGNRNARDLPFQYGYRGWSLGLCGCLKKGEHQCGTCCLAFWCPSILYGQNKGRFDYLTTHGTPQPREAASICNGDCALHAFLTVCFGVGFALQIPFRSSMRSRYSIAGSCLEDCATACFCSPCELTQEHVEINTEENSFPRGMGRSTGQYYTM